MVLALVVGSCLSAEYLAKLALCLQCPDDAKCGAKTRCCQTACVAMCQNIDAIPTPASYFAFFYYCLGTMCTHCLHKSRILNPKALLGLLVLANQ